MERGSSAISSAVPDLLSGQSKHIERHISIDLSEVNVQIRLGIKRFRPSLQQAPELSLSSNSVFGCCNIRCSLGTVSRYRAACKAVASISGTPRFTQRPIACTDAVSDVMRAGTLRFRVPTIMANSCRISSETELLNYDIVFCICLETRAASDRGITRMLTRKSGVCSPAAAASAASIQFGESS